MLEPTFAPLVLRLAQMWKPANSSHAAPTVGPSLVPTSRHLLVVATMPKAARVLVTLPTSFMQMRLLVVWVRMGADIEVCC